MPTLEDSVTEYIDELPVETVFISVYDKTDLDKLVRGLLNVNPNLKIISSGGTYRYLLNKCGLSEEEQSQVHDVSEYGGMDIMDGRVKTLIPTIYAGILVDRTNPKHMEELEELGMEPIDVLICNFYPLEKVREDKGDQVNLVTENKDIGGPAMISAAAKNWTGCVPICSIDQYNSLLAEVVTNGFTNARTRFTFAQVAEDHVAKYRSKGRDYFCRLDFDKDVAPCYESVQHRNIALEE